MDYQQSIKNLNHLKNFIRAWDECYIFFFFNSEANYDIEICGIEEATALQKKIDLHLRSRFPYGYVCNNSGAEETVYYCDKNIIVEYDLFAQQFNDFICFDPVDNKNLQKQFLILIEMLKNK